MLKNKILPMPNIIKIRALNNDGIQIFSDFITQTRQIEAKGGSPLPAPDHLLTNPGYLEKIDYNKEVDADASFSNRYELGVYLVNQLSGTFGKEHLGQPGLWAWLSLLWFAQLRGTKTQRNEHFIPYEWFKKPIELLNSTQKLGYRHGVRTSFLLVAEFGDKAKFFVSKGGVAYFGDACEQLLSRPDIISSAKYRELMFDLYRDRHGYMKTNSLDIPPKPTLARGSKKGYGGVRRLVKDVVPRVKLTHDVDYMPTSELLQICGPEFSSLIAKKKSKTKRRK